MGENKGITPRQEEYISKLLKNFDVDHAIKLLTLSGVEEIEYLTKKQASALIEVLHIGVQTKKQEIENYLKEGCQVAENALPKGVSKDVKADIAARVGIILFWDSTRRKNGV